MGKKHQQSEQSASQQQTGSQTSSSSSGSRDIYLFGRLENEVALPVIRRLIKLNKTDKTKPINMYINSSGGNGYNADAIIAVMHSIDAPVNTICLGHALSGACEILASGTGERSSYEFATLMFHQTLWEADGDITNLEIQAAQGQRFRDAQIELLHRCTGQDKNQIRKDIERDHYMSARDALNYGIIDKVIEHSKASGVNGDKRASRSSHAKVAESVNGALKNNSRKAAAKSLGKKNSSRTITKK